MLPRLVVPLTGLLPLLVPALAPNPYLSRPCLVVHVRPSVVAPPHLVAPVASAWPVSQWVGPNLPLDPSKWCTAVVVLVWLVPAGLADITPRVVEPFQVAWVVPLVAVVAVVVGVQWVCQVLLSEQASVP